MLAGVQSRWLTTHSPGIDVLSDEHTGAMEARENRKWYGDMSMESSAYALFDLNLDTIVRTQYKKSKTSYRY